MCQDDETPLHVAAARGHIECIRCLLDCSEGGAVIDTQDRGGATPLHLAIRSVTRTPLVIHPSYPPLHTNSYPPLPRRHHTHAALLLLHSGADFDTADSEGETAVHVCARDGQLGLAQTLCAFGCNVDVANCEGMQVHTIQGVTQYRGTPCVYSVQYLYNLCPAAAPPGGQARQHRGGALPVPGRGEHRRQEPRGGGRRDVRPGPGTAPHIYRISTYIDTISTISTQGHADLGDLLQTLRRDGGTEEYIEQLIPTAQVQISIIFTISTYNIHNI